MMFVVFFSTRFHGAFSLHPLHHHAVLPLHLTHGLHGHRHGRVNRIEAALGIVTEIEKACADAGENSADDQDPAGGFQ